MLRMFRLVNPFRAEEPASNLEESGPTHHLR